jgi:hypothetical protein
VAQPLRAPARRITTLIAIIRRIPRRFRILFLAILGFLTLAVSAFLVFFDAQYVERLLLEQVQAQLGRQIEVGRTHLQIFPVRLQLSDVVVRDADPARTFFRAKHLDLHLRIFPLLRQRVVWKRLAIDQPYLEFRRDQAGHWNLPSGVEAVQGPDRPIGMVLLFREAALTNGEVTIIDEFRPGGLRSLQFSSVTAVISTAVTGPPADVKFSATLQGSQGPASLIINGRISQADGQTGLSQQPPAEPNRPAALQFVGNAEARKIDLRQIADFLGPRPIPDKLRGVADLRGQVRVAPGVAGYDGVLSDMAAEIEELSINGQASVSGLMTAQPTFSVTFSASPVDFAQLNDRFPVEWLNPQIQRVITEGEIGGVVQVLTATVSGGALPQPSFSFTGELEVRDGHALIGKARTPAKDLTGTVMIEPDRILVNELTGFYGKSRITGGKVLLTLSEAGPVVDMELKGEVPGPELVRVLTHALGSAEAVRILTALRDVTGDTEIALRLAGPLNEEPGLRFGGAEIMARNVGFRSPAVPDPIANLNGTLVFSRTEVLFENLTGRIGRTQFEVQGAMTIGPGSVFRGMTVRAKADVPQLVKLFPAGMLPGPALSGSMGIAAAITGPVRTPRVKAVLELEETKLSFPGIVEKLEGTPATVEVDGEWTKEATVALNRLELAIPPFRLTGKGRLHIGKKFSIDATLVSGAVALAGLPPGLSIGGGVQSGTVEITLDVKGKGNNWKAWQITGWIALTDGMVAAKGMEHALTNLYLRVKLTRNSAEVKRMEFRIKESDVRLAGVVRNWRREPDIRLSMESSQFDIDLVIPKGARSPIRDLIEELAATGRLVASISIDTGVYEQLTLTHLSGKLRISDGEVEVHELEALSGGGTVGGRLLFRLPKQKPPQGEVTFRLGNMPFEEFTHLFGSQEHPIVGDLSLSGFLSGHGRHPRGVSRSLDGSMELSLERGRFLKFTAMSKILSILNLPTLLQGKVDLSKDGMPYDKIKGTFQVKEGIVSTENLVVDSPVMKMSAAGTYDISANQLNFVVATSPFGSYSQFLKSIPLFGKLLIGERRGVDTALFEVKGPLQNPEVKYLPLKSFATGLTGLAHLAIHVLRNAVLLPKNLIAPSDEEDTAPVPFAPAPPKPSSEPEPPPASSEAPPPPAPSPPSGSP